MEFGSEVLVGRLVVLGSAENEATAEGERLGSGAGQDQGLKLFAVLFGEDDG